MKIIVAGDVMLGRLVKDAILARGIDYPMAAISSLMHRGDLTIVNLECAVTQHPHIWSGAEKPFYFGAPPEAAKILADLKVDCVSLANNHALDYNYQGLIDTLAYLDEYKIQHAGAGENIDAALQPTIIECEGITFGMVAYCDHQPDFAATVDRPGIAFINLDFKEEALQHFQTSLQGMQEAGVQWPILSLHWGPNMVDRPSQYFMDIAHAAIDMGYQMLFGHSAHVFHGIEIYKGCPILYAAGDCVDDYAVDPYFKNDHQLIFELQLQDNKLQRIFLYPIFISNCRVQAAVDDQFTFIRERMLRLCGEMGTTVKPYDEQRLVIEI